MRQCPSCTGAVPPGADTCPDCGAEIGDVATDATIDSGDTTGPGIADADYDPAAERERFERRFGVDLGDRTIEEFLVHLGRQDYSLTPWFWLVVAAEAAGIALLGVALFGDVRFGGAGVAVFGATAALLALAIFADTRVVGLFERWAKIRWTYILMAAIPLFAHLAGLFYLVLRRLKHEQAVEYRRRLLDAGFDVGVDSADD